MRKKTRTHTHTDGEKAKIECYNKRTAHAHNMETRHLARFFMAQFGRISWPTTPGLTWLIARQR